MTRDERSRTLAVCHGRNFKLAPNLGFRGCKEGAPSTPHLFLCASAALAAIVTATVAYAYSPQRSPTKLPTLTARTKHRVPGTERQKVGQVSRGPILSLARPG